MTPDWALATPAIRKAAEDGVAVWDQERADDIISFTSAFFKSQFSTHVKLAEPQSRFLQQLYGWRLKDGRRLIRLAHLHVPKKSFGKTMIASAICLFELFAGDEPSPLVVSAAASRENAGQVFDEVRFSIENSPFKRHVKIKRHTKEILVKSANATYRSLASEGKRLHGYNASTVVLDEAHAAPADLWSSLRWAIAARPKSGLVVVISTSGQDQSHWYYSLYQKSKKVLSGEDDDVTHLPVVYESDADGNPEDPEQWRKANPLLGSPWCPFDQFERDMKSAKSAGMGEWLSFLRLRLNRWVRADELAFFDVSDWDKLRDEVPDEVLVKLPCAVGVDISETTDPSSVSITWELEPGRYYTRTRCWVAEEGLRIREKANMSRFDVFVNEGSMKVTKGDMLDERDVLGYLIELNRKYRVQVNNFDPRAAYVLANRLSEEGVRCERVPPSARFFNPAMREIEKSLKEGRLKHDGSSWLRFCLENVRVQVNKYDEVYPVRKRSVDKIDSSISLCLSMLGLMTSKPTTVTQGIVML